MGIKGTGGDDVLVGTGGDDIFNLLRGGEDRASGLGGNDLFLIGATFDAGDRIDGGDGFDRLVLRGDYSSGLTFGHHTLTNVEAIQLRGGFSYSLITANATVAAGETLRINAVPLRAGQSLVFDGSHEKDGSFFIFASAGDDVLTGGKMADAFHLGRGGADIAHGGGGADTFYAGAHFDAADQVQGGNGADTLILKGDYSSLVTFSDSTIASIETLKLNPGHDYNLVLAEGNVAAGQTLTIDAGHLGTNGDAFIDGGALTTGTLHFIDGGGQNVFTGGSGGDVFDLQNGSLDSVTGGGGRDIINAGASLSGKTIDGGAGNDTLTLNGDYSVPTIFDGSAVQSVEKIAVAAGHDYAFSFTAGFVPAGHVVTVDASALGSSNSLDVTPIAISGGLAVTGGAGNDVFSGDGNAVFANSSFNGGAGNDTLNIADLTALLTLDGAHYQSIETLGLSDDSNYILTLTGSLVASGATLTIDGSTLVNHKLLLDITAETNGAFDITGGAMADTVTFANDTVTGNSSFDGGAGNDTLLLNGGFNFQPTSLSGFSSIESVQFADGDSYRFTTADNFVDAGKTATIDGGTLTGVNALYFDGSAETNGVFHFTGGAAGDTLKGGAGTDTFDLSHGGEDTAVGGGGGDTFNMGGAFDAGDSIDGGAGTGDKVVLDGDYSDTSGHQVAFGSTTMMNVETLLLTSGHDYFLTLSDATVASGATLTVDASGTSTINDITVIGSSETNGNFAFIGGLGSSTFAGGAGADTFDVTASSEIFITGGGGDDVISVAGNLVAGDHIDGTSGNDTFNLDGDYGAFSGHDITFGSNTIKNIDSIVLGAGHDYYITLNDGNVTAGDTMTIDASALASTDVININGSQETDGHLNFISGASDFTLTGGDLSDSFNLAGSSEGDATGNGGADTFAFAGNYTALAVTVDGGAGNDTVTFNGNYSSLALSDGETTSVETLKFLGGHNYTGVSVTGDFSESALTIDASGANSISIDLSGATATSINVTGGTHSDTFIFGADFDPNVSSIIGNGGGDVVSLNGDYSGADALTFTAANFTGVGEIDIAAGHSYSFTTVDANVASGTELFVNGLNLGGGDTLTFHGSAETNGFFDIVAGAGSDTLTGGSGNDTFQLGDGTNVAHGGGGADTFFLGADHDTISYSAASDSTLSAMDTVGNFSAASDHFDFTAAVTAVSNVTVDTLSQATLSADLVANCTGLQGDTVYVVTGGASGDLSGHSFLVIDGNGVTGFQANGDSVIDITGHSGTITTGNFI